VLVALAPVRRGPRLRGRLILVIAPDARQPAEDEPRRARRQGPHVGFRHVALVKDDVRVHTRQLERVAHAVRRLQKRRVARLVGAAP